MLRKLRDNWEKEILRPIVVSLMTALCLFLASLAFAPVREFLFPPEGDRDYPIYCVAEPYKNPTDPQKLNVDFFIINRTGNDLERAELVRRLRPGQVQQSAALGPDVTLHYNRRIGRVEAADLEDVDFNSEKGNVRIGINGNDVRIEIQYIKARSVMKVTIKVAGLSNLEGISRTGKGAVPFDYDRYQIACHDR